MLKLSNDKTKLKRRIPFRRDSVNTKETDNCMVYIERFPEELTNDQLVMIFKRAGHVKHVSMPKYKNSSQSKGFAFIQYQSPEEAQTAVDMLENTIPVEFIDAMTDSYIPVQGIIRPLRVILKTDWLKMKDEMNSIKREIALLHPEDMYQPK